MQSGTHLPAAERSGAKRHTRRVVVAAAVLAGGLAAAASSLGALDGTGISPAANKTVAPGSSVAAACDPDGVTASFTTAWDATHGRYGINAVAVSGVSDTCDGERMEVVLRDSRGAEIGHGVVALESSAATSFHVPLPNAPSAEAAADVHIVLSG